MHVEYIKKKKKKYVSFIFILSVKFEIYSYQIVCDILTYLNVQTYKSFNNFYICLVRLAWFLKIVYKVLF